MQKSPVEFFGYGEVIESEINLHALKFDEAAMSEFRQFVEGAADKFYNRLINADYEMQHEISLMKDAKENLRKLMKFLAEKAGGQKIDASMLKKFISEAGRLEPFC